MTTPNHMAQSGLLQYVICPQWYLIVIAVVLALLPDVSIWYQRLILRRNTEEINWNGWYKMAHESWWALLIPYFNVHVGEDFFVHKKEGGWKWWAYPLEIVTDLILLKILFL